MTAKKVNINIIIKKTLFIFNYNNNNNILWYKGFINKGIIGIKLILKDSFLNN